jgi:voltage-gated potassium channel
MKNKYTPASIVSSRRSYQLLAMRRALATFTRWLGRPKLLILILVITLLIVVVGTTAMWLAEQALGGEPAFTNWANAFWYMLSSVAGIGVGAKTPLTETGRTVAIIGGVFGSALKGVFTAAVASAFVNRLILEGKGLGDYDLSDHIIICGWNNRAKEMLKVLEEQAFGRGLAIVLLADVPENPLPNTRVKFVRGDPTLDRDLERASTKNARSAVILADESHGVQDDATTDARTVLTTLAVEAANSNIYTIAEVCDPANRRHFARTKTDELVASSELAGGLLARTALNPGIGHVFEHLMRLDKSAEMFLSPAPPTMVGKSFDDVLKYLRREQQGILIGLARNGDVVLSPKGDQVLCEGDRLVMIASARPTSLSYKS